MKKFGSSVFTLRMGILSISLLFSSCLMLWGQATNFTRGYAFAYPAHNSTQLEDIALLPSGQMVAVGNFLNWGLNSDSIKPFIILADAHGNPTWVKAMSPRGDTVALWHVVAGNDGNIVVAGMRDDTVFVSKIGLGGQVIWASAVSFFTWKSRIQVELIAGNGGYYLMGTTKAPCNASSCRMIARIEENGTTAWMKSYQAQNNYPRFESIALSPAGNLVVSGLGGIASNTPSGPSYSGPMIILDPAGNVVSARAYRSNNPSGLGGKGDLLAFANGDFAKVDYLWQNTLLLTRMNPSGAVLWGRFLEGDANDNAQLTEDESGGLILAKPEQTISNPVSSVPIFLRFDAAGNYLGCQGPNVSGGTFLAEIVRGNDCDIYLGAVQTHPDYGLALLGRSDSTLTFGSGSALPAVLVQNAQMFDTVLTILPDTISYTTSPFSLSLLPFSLVVDSILFSSPQVICPTTQTDGETDAGSLDIFPNPMREELRVVSPNGKRISQVRLHDLQGRLLIRADGAPGQVVLPTADLAPGIYFLTAEVGGRVLSRKVMKQ